MSQSKEVSGGVESSTRRGLLATFGAQFGRLGIQSIAYVILGRILVPGDFGLIAQSAVFANFISMFKDIGLGQATIQRETLDDQTFSAIFWICVSVSLALCGVVVLSSPGLRWLYSDERLVGINSALGVQVLVAGVGIQHRSLLHRRMQFGRLAWIEILASLFGSVVAVILALSGFGYWSIISLTLFSEALVTISCIVQTGQRVGKPRFDRSVWEMLGFGVNLSGFRILNYWSRNADKFLIGRGFGEVVLGQYDVAYRFLLLPISQITGPASKVLLPALSRLQGSPVQYQSTFLNHIRWISWVTMIPIATASVWGEFAIVLALGENWRDAGKFFEILAVAGMWQPATSIFGLLFVSMGKTREFFIWGLVSSVLTVAGFVVGMRWGPVGVASAYAVTTLCLCPAFWALACGVSHVSAKSLIRVIWLPAGLGLAIVMVSKIFWP